MELVCPACRAGVDDRGDAVECTACGRRYARSDGVVAFVTDESEQHAIQRAYFDTSYETFEQYAIENWRASYLERIFAALELAPERDRYLDVGTGATGAAVIEAARRGVDSYGCDLSVVAVSRARSFAVTEGVADRATFVVSAAEELPFPDASFTRLSAVALLEHLDDDGAGVREMARVLAPGGRAWVMVPHAFRYMPPPVWPVYWWHDRKLGHKRHYREHDLVEVFARHGFEPLATEFSAHPVKLVQFALGRVLPSLRQPSSSWWWRLERLDRRAKGRPLGALHVAALFRKR